jgi:hypothetical protein
MSIVRDELLTIVAEVEGKEADIWERIHNLGEAIVRLRMIAERVESDKDDPNAFAGGSLSLKSGMWIESSSTPEQSPVALPDVLRRAKEALELISWVKVGFLGLACASCGKETSEETPKAERQHHANCKLVAALAAIDRYREPQSAAVREERRACPCLHTTPCHPRCTCVSPVSSSGCRRCCSYGSPDQQRTMAEELVARLEPGHSAALGAPASEGRCAAALGELLDALVQYFGTELERLPHHVSGPPYAAPRLAAALTAARSALALSTAEDFKWRP